MKPRLALALSTSAAAVLLAAATALARPDEWIDAFRAENSSDKRREMLGAIPVEKGAKAVSVLLTALAEDSPSKADWYVREAGLDALAKVRSDDKKAAKILENVLEKPKPETARLRASIVAALGRSKDAGYIDLVIAALDDPQAVVRRAAAFALRQLRDAKGAAALVKRLEAYDSGKSRKPSKKAEADGYRELVDYARALADLAPEDQGRDAKKWLAWWEANAKAFKLREDFTDADRAALARARKEEIEKSRTTTVERGITVGHTTAGKGKVKLLVIHDDAWEGDYFEPWLEPLHDTCEITYVRLPQIEDFDQTKVKLEKSPGGLPYYPVDQLADVFDDIRKAKGFERFAIMAHGFSTLVAARYVTRHAETVSHVVFLGGLTGDSAYGNILSEMEKYGNNVWKDKELTNMVMNHYVDDEKTGKSIYEPTTDAEAMALQRKAFDLYWADPTDPYVGEVFEMCKRKTYIDPEAKKEHIVLSPEFDIAREKKPADLPVLVIVGKKSLWSSVADNERLAKNYPRGKIAVFESSGMFPFVEEADRFQEEMRAFLK